MEQPRAWGHVALAALTLSIGAGVFAARCARTPTPVRQFDVTVTSTATSTTTSTPPGIACPAGPHWTLRTGPTEAAERGCP